MASITLADMAHSFALRRQNTALQADVQRLSVEAVTGLAADTGRAVGGDHTELSAISGSLARLEAYGAANTLAATLAAGTQAALASIDKAVGSLGIDMADPTLTGSGASVASLGESALQAFRSVVAALNTQISGQSLFAGNRTDGPALAGADAMLASMGQAVAGAGSADAAQAAIDDWFATAFPAEGYTGGPARAAMIVGESESVGASVTAADPALVDTLKALATAALAGTGTFDADTKVTLMRNAGAALIDANDRRTVVSARIGAAEARIDDVRTRQTAQISALEQARVDILSVDSYETAVRLEATQTQIETLYSVTARLSQMTLADYL